MRRRLQVSALLLLASPALFADITVIGSAMSGAVGTATATVNCSGSNWASVVVSEYYANFSSNPMTGTVTSSPSNTWTCKPSRADGGNSQLEICYSDSAATTNGMTFTYTPTDQTHLVTVVAICATGVASSGSNDQYHSNSGLEFLQVGPVTPTTDKQLVITAATSDETTGTSGGWHVYEYIGGSSSSTSSTSVTPANGSLSFTVGSGLALTNGQPILIESRGSNSFIFGTITSYSGTSLVMNATEVNGTVRSDWDVNQLSTNYTVLYHRQVVGSGGGAGDAIAVASLIQTTATTTNPIWDGMFSGPGLVASFIAAPPSTPSSMVGQSGMTGNSSVH